MAMSIEVKFDEKKLRELQRLLRSVPQELPGLMSKAINRTATSVKAEIARRISAKVKITQKAVKKGMVIRKASRKRWFATVSVGHKRIPLVYFGARQTKKGVSYRIEKSGPRKFIKSAFKQTMPVSGHIGVFKRTGGNRLPIVQLLGPSPAGVFEGAAEIARQVIASSKKTLEKNIDSQVAFILSRRKAG